MSCVLRYSGRSFIETVVEGFIMKVTLYKPTICYIKDRIKITTRSFDPTQRYSRKYLQLEKWFFSEYWALKEGERILLKFKARKKAAQKKAEKRLDKLEKLFYMFQKENDCIVDFYYDGDTHGIYDDGLYISVRVDGFEFSRNLEN